MSTDSMGVLVPPANPNVEPELRRLIPVDIPWYTARLPVVDAPLAERLETYRTSMADTATTLRGLQVTSLVVACTASQYPGGATDDAAAAAECEESLAGAKATTSAGAILTVFRKLGVRSVCLASPYPAWLDEQSVSFWRSGGLEVAEVFKIPGTGKIYDLAADTVAKALDEVLPAAAALNADALLVTGTGAPSLSAIEARCGSSPMPVISSNIASAWVGLANYGYSFGDAAAPLSPALIDLNNRMRAHGASDQA